MSAGVSLAVRLRRARGEQGQQLKWLAYAAVLTAVTWAASTTSFLLFGTPWWLATLVIGALDAIPVAAGIAILRYRLYDIDRIINRTLVYGLLSALLAVVHGVPVDPAATRPLKREPDATEGLAHLCANRRCCRQRRTVGAEVISALPTAEPFLLTGRVHRWTSNETSDGAPGW